MVTELGVHPNPALTYFTLKISTLKDGMATIRVTDFTGRAVLYKTTDCQQVLMLSHSTT